MMLMVTVYASDRRGTRLFLTEGALQLLVVDLYKFCRDSSCRGDAVYIWLDALLCRLPACSVLVVATHGDRFGENRGEVDAALRHLQAAIEEYMEDKRKEWNRAVHMQSNKNNVDRSAQKAPSLRLCGVVEASGCSTDDLCRLRDIICSLAEEGGRAADGKILFPSVGQTVPVSWARVWQVMEALHRGADPFVAVQSIGRPVDPVEGLAKNEFVTWEHAWETWGEVVSRLNLATEVGGRSEDREEVLKAALTMRQVGGTMLVTCGLVHLDPSWINVLLRALLDHRLVDPTEASWWTRQIKEYCSDAQAFGELTQTHRNFVRTGRLTETYLRFLWREIPELADMDVFKRMVSTLSQHGAIFRCKGMDDIHAQELMVPARLPARIEAETLSRLESAVSHGYRTRLILEIHSNYVPAGVISHFLGTVPDTIDDMVFRSCWNRGAAFYFEGMEHLICLQEHTNGGQRRIEIVIAGSTETAVFNRVNAVRRTLRALFNQRYPGAFLDSSADPEFLEGRSAWQEISHTLKEHLERGIDKLQRSLEIALDGILDVFERNEAEQVRSHGSVLGQIDEALVRRLDRVCVDMERQNSQQFEKRASALLNDLWVKIDDISAAVRTDSQKEILEGLASGVARLRWPVPRLACLLPEYPETLTEDDRSYSEWSARLRRWCKDREEADRGKWWQRFRQCCRGKEYFCRELRLFFLCAHDLSLAECGPGGQGYAIKELLEWVKRAMPAAKVVVTLGGIVLRTCTGLLLPIDQFKSATGDMLGDAVSNIFSEAGTMAEAGGMADAAVDNLNEDEEMGRLIHSLEAHKVNPRPVDGFEYDWLAEAVKGFERRGMKTRNRGTAFRRFDSAMRFVDREGHGLEWAWVRTHNVDAFRGEMSPSYRQ